jgi:hypothetical protein
MDNIETELDQSKLDGASKGNPGGGVIRDNEGRIMIFLYKLLRVSTNNRPEVDVQCTCGRAESVH